MVTTYMRSYIRKTSLPDASITLEHDPEGIVLHAENRIALNSNCYMIFILK